MIRILYLSFAFSAILTSFSIAGNNTIVLSSGINHHFLGRHAKQKAINVAFIEAFSLNLQYSHKSNKTFCVGLRTILHNFNNFREGGFDNISIPTFLTVNYRLIEMDGGYQLQLAAGPTFRLKSRELLENNKINNAFQTGYGAGIFNGYYFKMWKIVNVYAEGGILYERFLSQGDTVQNSSIEVLFNIGLALIY